MKHHLLFKSKQLRICISSDTINHVKTVVKTVVSLIKFSLATHPKAKAHWNASNGSTYAQQGFLNLWKNKDSLRIPNCCLLWLWRIQSTTTIPLTFQTLEYIQNKKDKYLKLSDYRTTSRSGGHNIGSTLTKHFKYPELILFYIALVNNVIYKQLEW